MNNYGHMLILGFGVPADYKEACKYFKQAADLGDTEAMVSYGLCLSSGQGVEVNKEEALQYFKKAAGYGQR
ncbi:hypothetical protein M9Y10_017672 [Tritrichomonas musculus]|uniref:Uncharacterized protein n=1 Tax=Tritrichomonas musculus TaxID=1915356 RepID=A0ABR2HV13_9EUKA